MINNSATFSRKSIGFEEFLNQMVEALDITIDRPYALSERYKENGFIIKSSMDIDKNVKL